MAIDLEQYAKEKGISVDPLVNAKGAEMSPSPVRQAPKEYTFQDYSKIANDAAEKYDIPKALLLAQITQESGWKPNAISPKGAQGLMQLMPETARSLGVTDPSDPVQNINGGAKYLRQMHDKYGRWDYALAAYNAGPGNVDQYGGIPPFKETQKYVPAILNRAKTYEGLVKSNENIEQAQQQGVNEASPIDLEQYAKEKGIGDRPTINSNEIAPGVPLIEGTQKDTYYVPRVVKEAQRRLAERQEGSLVPDAGNFLTKLGDLFKLNQTIGGIGQTISGEEPRPGEGILSNISENMRIEDAVQKLRTQQSPISSELGKLVGMIAPYGAGLKVLEGVPVIGKAALGEGAGMGSKLLELLKASTRSGLTNVGIGQVSGHGTESAPSDFAFGAVPEVAGSVLQKGIRSGGNYLKSKLAPQIMNLALGMKPQDLLKAQRSSSLIKDLGEEALQRNLSGSAKGLLEKSGKGLDLNESALQKLLSRADESLADAAIPPPLPKNLSAYVHSPERASKDELAEYVTGLDQRKIQEFLENGLSGLESASPVQSSGFKERAFVRRPKSVSTALSPDEVITRKSSSPFGRDLPSALTEPLKKENTEILREIIPNKANILTQNTIPKGKAPNVNKEDIFYYLKQQKDALVAAPPSIANKAKLRQVDRQIELLASDPSKLEIPPSIANELKRAQTKSIGAPAYDKAANPFKTELEQDIASGYRRAVEEGVPPELKSSVLSRNKELAFYKTLQDKMAEKVAKGGVLQVPNSINLIPNVLEAISGGTYGKTKAAQAVYKTGKKLAGYERKTRLLTPALGELKRQGSFNKLYELLGLPPPPGTDEQ